MHNQLTRPCTESVNRTLSVRRRLRNGTIYAAALNNDPSATLNDLREAVTMLEELEPYARRVLGGAHPIARSVEQNLRHSRAALRARETLASIA